MRPTDDAIIATLVGLEALGRGDGTADRALEMTDF
jgi:hypothetical protein